MLRLEVGLEQGVVLRLVLVVDRLVEVLRLVEVVEIEVLVVELEVVELEVVEVEVVVGAAYTDGIVQPNGGLNGTWSATVAPVTVPALPLPLQSGWLPVPLKPKCHIPSMLPATGYNDH